MPGNILLYERQTIRQKWLWLLLGGTTLYLLYGSFAALFIQNSTVPPMMATSLLIMLGVDILLWLMKLEFLIKNDGFYFRFRPFTIRYKRVAWEDLEEIRVRTYKPLREFGGWGLRIGFGGQGMALTISGNKGVQLVFKNGRRILIGTRQAEKVEEILAQIMKPHSTE